MKVHLTRALHIDKNYYPAGPQEIPAETLKTKMFAKHIKAGHILEPSQVPRKVVAQTTKQRADILLEKVFGKQKQNATPEEAEELGGVKSQDDGGVKSQDEAPVEADEAAPVKSNKKNR